ncbi:pro-sigmaK processing inhibitor BofA family protein [Bacillus carboniphilus]|uniref:Pro-sigmaK processing inhibitor BofA family protein n=1 Tax=Bacillus carboniphilus TaxID=86663 RepID=A0ABY9JRF0_9BACI|nr:pro-sigmaK processing inhibitor BofA family protein [Bacillus carboniphilus]WLR41907.1 pro-sigmaK processing inhibitor BofA family protein [Bacillus carboniphilus]
MTINLVIVLSIVGLLLLFLLLGTSFKPLRYVGYIASKIIIGALLLFFLNVLGTTIGLHIPINFLTATVSGLLGISGVAALIVIQTMIL